jgi:HSP20 family protein
MASVILKNSLPVRNGRSWSVLSDFDNIVDRIFDSYQPYQNESFNSQMPIELTENGDNFELKAMLPGLKKEDVNIEVSEDSVAISGEYKKDEKKDDNFIHASEFFTGKFSRSITLPQKIDHQKAKADYKDGILSIILPKSQKEINKVVKLSL